MGPTLIQSAWSTSAGFGMAITYAVAMRKKEDIGLNAFLTGLGNNSVSLIAGVAVLVLFLHYLIQLRKG